MTLIYGYSDKDNIFGKVTVIDYASNTVGIVTEHGTRFTLKHDEVKFLHRISDTDVFDADVIMKDGEKFLVEKSGDYVKIFSVDDGLHVIDLHEQLHVGTFAFVYAKATVFGNYYKLTSLGVLSDDEEKEVDTSFNIKVVKDQDGSYYYACNFVHEEKIDLIAVVFVGTEILEDVYSRETLSYEEYKELILDESIVEVALGEFKDFAMAKMRSAQEAPYDESEDEDCDCDECVACKSDEEEHVVENENVAYDKEDTEDNGDFWGSN